MLVFWLLYRHEVNKKNQNLINDEILELTLLT